MSSSSEPAPPAVEAAVRFPGLDGRQLAGVLTQGGAAGPFKPHQAAILLHGFGSCCEGFHLPALAHALATRCGLSCLRFDWAGNGDSEGEFRFGGFLQEVQQLSCARRWLEQEHGMQVVLVLGHSRGAIVATLWCGALGDDALVPPLLVLVAGRFDLKLNIVQRYGGPHVLEELRATGPWHQQLQRDPDGLTIHWQLTAEELEERFALDVPGACAAISAAHRRSGRPAVLVLHGGADPICEASDAARLAGAMEGAAQLLVAEPGADHWWKGKQAELLDHVCSFALVARIET